MGTRQESWGLQPRRGSAAEPFLHKRPTSPGVGDIPPLKAWAKAGPPSLTLHSPTLTRPASSPPLLPGSSLLSILSAPPTHLPRSPRVCSQRHRPDPSPSSSSSFNMLFGRLTPQTPGSHHRPLPRGLPSPAQQPQGWAGNIFSLGTELILTHRQGDLGAGCRAGGGGRERTVQKAGRGAWGRGGGVVLGPRCPKWRQALQPHLKAQESTCQEEHLVWGAGLGALPPASAGQLSQAHPERPALFSLAGLLGWSPPAPCPGDASLVRVCLLSLPTASPPSLSGASCSLALILPVAAQRAQGSLQRQPPTPPQPLALPPSSGLPLVSSGLAPGPTLVPVQLTSEITLGGW